MLIINLHQNKTTLGWCPPLTWWYTSLKGHHKLAIPPLDYQWRGLVCPWMLQEDRLWQTQSSSSQLRYYLHAHRDPVCSETRLGVNISIHNSNFQCRTKSSLCLHHHRQQKKARSRNWMCVQHAWDMSRFSQMWWGASIWTLVDDNTKSIKAVSPAISINNDYIHTLFFFFILAIWQCRRIWL